MDVVMDRILHLLFWGSGWGYCHLNCNSCTLEGMHDVATVLIIWKFNHGEKAAK